MTYLEDMEKAVVDTKRVAEILPVDTKKSRLQKPVRAADTLDDVATAGERIEAFWKKHPTGRILTAVEKSWDVEGATYYTMRAEVFRDEDTDVDEPHAMAYATRNTGDPDEVTAAFPQETAETSAVSRALRNLGILAVPKKTRAPRKPKEPTP